MADESSLSSSSASSDWDDTLVCYTADQILRRGMKLAGMSEAKIDKKNNESLIKSFVDRYGSRPVVYAQIWEDLQRTQVVKAFLPIKDRDKIDYYFMALHFLKRYYVEAERALMYDRHEDTVRDWTWYFVEKIQALKEEKIKWPEDNYKEDIWIMSVDGVHCPIQEPKHEEWSMDTRYYSHKYASAGLDYELGVSLTESRLIWMNGPFPAGQNDISIFKTKGLGEKLRILGKKAIADGGYHAIDEFDILTTPNSLDDKRVKKFKRRAQRRHETFNNYVKNFECTSKLFRHGEKRFGQCFEACCVIAQYQMEFGKHLYDIFCEGM